jgi:16S rRNA processing protein RimM
MKMARPRDSSYIRCGKIGRAVGLKGECAVFWDSGAAPVETGDKLYLQKGDDKRVGYKVAAMRSQGRQFILRLDGVCKRDEAEALTGSVVYVDKHDLPRLSEGEFYCHEIVGMDVVTEDGRMLGRVVKIFTAGENDVYEIVDADGKELLLPAISDVILSIDKATNRITVRLLEES